MPVNGAADRIHNLFEVDGSFEGNYLSQTVDANWSTVNSNDRVGQQNRIGLSLNPSLQNYHRQQLGSVGVQLSQRSDCSRSLHGNFQLGSDGFPIECQNLLATQNEQILWNENELFDSSKLTSKSVLVLQSQQEYEPLDSPTLTTNSERSEITEASSDFNFYQGRQQLPKFQQPVIPQFLTMQQSGYNDMQLLQQHMMVKQLQELKRQQQLQQIGDMRQQQLQQLGDMRQQNSLNQLPAVAKQTGGQFSPFVNGTPVHEGSQMFMNWGQRSAAPTAQGTPNRGMFPQEQGLALRSMGLVPQQLDSSLYGTPVANARSNMNQYSNLQGMSLDTINLLTKAGGLAQNSTMHPPGFNNPFMRDQSPVSANQVGMPQGASTPSQGFQGKNMFGQGPFLGLNNGVMTNTLQDGSPRMTTSLKELHGRQEQASWPVMLQKNMQVGGPQGLVPLDPIEEKILYNMDDDIWDPGFGKQSEVGVGGTGNPLACSDVSNSFLQSGSWSALMQSAVAEASSSDTGMQEEWSGLTFQNTEQSTENQVSNFIENDKQSGRWVDNNSSFNSKPASLFSDSSMTSNFPGFQQSGSQPSVEHREGLHRVASHDSIPKTPKDSGLWCDGNVQLKPPVVGSQQSQSFINMDNSWVSHMYDHSGTDTLQERVTSFNNVTQPQYTADANDAMYKGKEPDTHLWKTDGEYGANTFSRSTGAELVHGAPDNREDSQLKRFAALENYNAGGVHHANIQPSNDFVEHANQTAENKAKDHQITSGPHGFASKGTQEIYDKQQNLEKAGIPDFQGTPKASAQLPSRADFGSVNSEGSNVAVQASQSLVEFFHKQREDGSVAHFGSTNANHISSIPGVRIHTSAAQLYSNPSASQGSNLGLALPSQRLQNTNQLLTPQGSNQVAGYLNPRQYDSEVREKSQARVAHASSGHSLSSLSEISQTVMWDNNSAASGHAGLSLYLSMQGGSVPTFPSAPQHISNQSQLPFVSNALIASQTQQSILPGTVMEVVPASQPSGPQQGDILARPQNVRVNGPTYGHPSGFEPLKIPSNLNSSMEQPNSESQPEKLKSWQQVSSHITDSSKTTGLSQGLDYLTKPGDSMVVHQHQQDLDKAMDKGLNSASELNALTPGDAKLISFSMHEREEAPSSESTPQTASQNMLPNEINILGQKYSNSQSCVSNVVSGHSDNGQVNQPVVPPWFKQYALKNGQMLPLYEAMMAKAAAAQLSVVKPSQNLPMYTSIDHEGAASLSQEGTVGPSAAAALIANKQLSAPYVLPLDVVNQSLSIMRPKKRKTASSELLPWHKEVAQSSQTVHNISTAEQDWAQATNRVIEKVEYDTEILEDVQPRVRSKRRIILTTGLMQLLIRPAPAFISSAEAASHYDGVSYFVSRLALGDACSLTYCKNELPSSNMVSEKLGSTSDQHFSEVVEGLSARVNKLESAFERLDKAASVVDIRVECQEQERFAVINRFARFHSRGPADNSGTSSSTGAPKPTPQRYVTALAMPRKLPEGVQCFSL